MALDGLEPRRLTGAFWHQGATRFPLLSFADPASTDGCYHLRQGTGVWYASDQEQAAWAELFRHFTEEGVDPFEVRRRVVRVSVEGLEVLDLTNEQVRETARTARARQLLRDTENEHRDPLIEVRCGDGEGPTTKRPKEADRPPEGGLIISG